MDEQNGGDAAGLSAVSQGEPALRALPTPNQCGCELAAVDTAPTSTRSPAGLLFERRTVTTMS